LTTILSTLSQLHAWQPGSDTKPLEKSLVAIGAGNLADAISGSDPADLQAVIQSTQRELSEKAIGFGDMARGWIPPYPTKPIKTLADAKEFASKLLSDLEFHMSAGTADAIVLADVSRTLWNACASLKPLDIPAPKRVNCLPINSIDGCQQLQAIVGLKINTSNSKAKTIERNVYLATLADGGSTTKQLQDEHKSRYKTILTKTAVRQAVCYGRKILESQKPSLEV
jgi:hypothetical protein